MKFPEQVYLNYDPFSDSDRDTEVRCHTYKIVKTRKPQQCLFGDLIGLRVHDIPIGTKVRYDHGLRS